MLYCTAVQVRDGRHSQVQSDGRIINNARDPPGQRSVYIPPGDTRREIYRLSTFKEFPRESPVNPCDCAAYGFYYTGFRDRVKCFSCGQAVEMWLSNDDITSSLFHSLDCDLINGRESDNIPIPFSNQRRSNDSVSRTHPLVGSVGPRPQQLVRQVLMERTPIDVAGPSVTSSQSSAQYRPTHSTPPASVATAAFSSEYRNPNPISPPERSTVSSTDLSALFPCLHPIHPEMRTYEARLQTFFRNPGLWPQHRITATPQDIAAAGMHFLGERDRTQCWYCNGGLQNWDRDDDPWEEHAKWFPMCEFVLQQKGPDFVHEIIARYPNLRRPVLQAPPNVPAPSLQRFSHSESRLSTIVVSTGSGSRTREIMDPREESRTRNQNIEQEMTSSPIVSRARQMGFGEREIKAALKRQYELNNQGFANLEAMVDVILSIPEDAEEHTSIPSLHSSPSTSSFSATSSVREMQRLEQTRRCRLCGNGLAEVVFLPCGHLICCEECGRVTDTCPVCGSSIRDRIRSYLS